MPLAVSATFFQEVQQEDTKTFQHKTRTAQLLTRWCGEAIYLYVLKKDISRRPQPDHWKTQGLQAPLILWSFRRCLGRINVGMIEQNHHKVKDLMDQGVIWEISWNWAIVVMFIAF